MLRLCTAVLLLGRLLAVSSQYISPDKKTDGLGSQLQGKISCLLEASSNSDAQYVHTPFKKIQHGVDRRLAEAFFNLGENEIPADMVPETSILHVLRCHDFADSNAHLYGMLRPLLRNKYFSPAATRKPRIPEFRQDEVNVGIHIRQGDALCTTGGSPHMGFSRCIPHVETASIMLEVVKMLRRHNISQAVNFQIYTQGQLDGFPKALLQQHGHQYVENLDTNVFDAFHAFVSADVLVLGHSSFSYAAALYNDNVVIWHQFWHSKVKGWIEYADGYINDSDIVHQHSIQRLRQTVAARAKTTNTT